jgi:NAD(P)-dependent dehydrogenase (short-subunit alcohol dehydrogenase family)
MQAFDFTGKTVFVAGGTSGINLGIAEAFAKAGAKLAVVSRSQNRIDEAQRQLRVFGGEVMALSADVRNVEAISAALKTAHDSLGEIDILVSGAAGNFPSRALDMSANGFKAVVDIDLLGTFNVLRHGHAHLHKPGGCRREHFGPASLASDAITISCLCCEGWGRYAHPRACY